MSHVPGIRPDKMSYFKMLKVFSCIETLFLFEETRQSMFSWTCVARIQWDGTIFSRNKTMKSVSG